MKALSRGAVRSINFWLLIAFAAVAVGNLDSYRQVYQQLKPRGIYSLKLDIRFEPDDETINIETFLPLGDDRQTVLDESVSSGDLDFLSREDADGRIARWSGPASQGRVRYEGIVGTREVQYRIDRGLRIPGSYPAHLDEYLQPTPVVQSDDPEIGALWASIRPADADRLFPVIDAIYQYTYRQIAWAPFKGTTSALTALRLKQASCNGKSRLFVALARHAGIPARLVGGIVLNDGRKKTSHQWVEVFIDGHWVPFGPTNGVFARLPANYLTLYRNDHSLFTHTADINFDYLFDIDRRLVAPGLYPVDLGGDDEAAADGFNLTRVLLSMGLAPKVIGLFLLFPLCTLALTLLRNVVGIKTFGVFMPMLIAAACVFTGLVNGIAIFGVILAVCFLAYAIFEKIHLLRVARLAAVITLNTLIIVAAIAWLGVGSGVELGMLSLFPVVIISYIAEQVHQLAVNRDGRELLATFVGTLLSIAFCYLILQSFVLESLFSYHPEFYLLVLAALVYIGQWTGLRLSEIHRFRSILGDPGNPVLGINGRNRNLVSRLNHRDGLSLAADKLRSKALLARSGVAVPETLLVIDGLARVDDITRIPGDPAEFVVKPNEGSQGKGILVITGRDGDAWVGAGGKRFDAARLRQHCIDIVTGVYSQTGEADIAYLEPLLRQYPIAPGIAEYGLSDIRVIANQRGIVSAMLRIPTAKSNGKANLHQAAVGVAIDVDSGKTTLARVRQRSLDAHPDSGTPLIGLQVPRWDEIREMAIRCQQVTGLGYIGVDICIDRERGPLVLEVNGRPGLEIQNVQKRGFRHEFQF